MKVIIHDLENGQFRELFPNVGAEAHIISDNGRIQPCIGCFGCWIKTPGQCVIRDSYDNMGKLLSRADSVIIISKCCYGGYSPFVKNVLDRSISYLLPFFKIKNKESHHKQRYKNRQQLSVYFYGEGIASREKETAQSLVKANCVNFNMQLCNISFSQSLNQLCGEINPL